MILPAWVTKGAGMTEALADMGLSRHNAIGVGDAENDHSLLDACEVGAAVASRPSRPSSRITSGAAGPSAAALATSI